MKRTSVVGTQVLAEAGPVPDPMAIAEIARRLSRTGDRLNLAGWGGGPPADLKVLPGPELLLDQERDSRAGYVLRAQTLFGSDLAPIAQELAQLEQHRAEHLACWQLYRYGTGVLSGVADYQLVAGPAHRRVRVRVLQATLEVLQEGGLPDDERDALAMDLAEMRALLAQETAQLAAARAHGAQLQADLQQQLAELQDEEHLVDVMMRMTTREPISQEEMGRASATYERLLQTSTGPDGGPATPPAGSKTGTRANRRGRGR